MLEYVMTAIFPMFVLTVALKSDLKEGIIPDWLTYSSILIMLLFRIFFERHF